MDEQTPYNAGDEAQVKGRKQKAKRDAEQWSKDLNWVMGTAQGRRVMWALWERGGVNRISFDAINPHLTSFREGSRNLANQFLAEVQVACPELYLTAMKEAQQKEEANG